MCEIIPLKHKEDHGMYILTWWYDYSMFLYDGFIIDRATDIKLGVQGNNLIQLKEDASLAYMIFSSRYELIT